ncbi:MAG: D-aminoacylase, partial [Gemmatimonadota bacterium]
QRLPLDGEDITLAASRTTLVPWRIDVKRNAPLRMLDRSLRRSVMIAAALASLAAGSALAQQSAEATGHYDVLIRNGRVLDGNGNPWFRADVGLVGARIEAVGDLAEATADRVIDATGLYVAPGFIDTHSHAGGGLTTAGLSHARPLLAQGITTVFVNPDGGGAVDLAEQRAELLAHGLGVNVAQLVPHGSVRSAVIGMEDRLATPAELERMRTLVRRGMTEGAWGLSSGPFYAPGSYSDTRELVELARVAAEYGGSYQSHVRDESTYTIGVMAAVEEVVTVAREAGSPGVWSHAKALGPEVWGYPLALIRRLEQARNEGVEVYMDQYPYTASATSLAAALLPRWAQAGGGDSLQARLSRPDDLARIRGEMVENLARRGGADRIQFRRFPQDPSIEGRTLADVAREREVDAIEAAVQLFREGSPSIVSHNMDERDVELIMAHPMTMTASDGGLVPWQEGVPHPRSYGAFTRKLETYVLEQHVVSLEQAVHSMTSLPARVYRMPDRGQILPGAVADLVVFDLARVHTPAVFTDPHHLSEGMVHVFVNGQSAITDEAFTGTLAGEVLRKR